MSPARKALIAEALKRAAMELTIAANLLETEWLRKNVKK
jgi:hypothetical protein